ncbi:hypothetical protein EDD16DRAFT_1018969 [Pisolithus croceorrhizus]|nr:hypothetical protein EDD16DRAFT_1018969 [Pisolithus croceorrhizus]
MNFPLLRRLTLVVKDPVPFLEAIVALKFPSFSFSRGHCEGPVSNKTYNGSRTKFDNVSRLALSSVYMTDKHTLVLLKLLYQIFFGIRHASVHMDHVSTLFTSYGPIEHWRYLANLDIQRFVLDSPRLFHWGDSISNTGATMIHIISVYVQCPSYKQAMYIPPEKFPFAAVPKCDCPAFHACLNVDSNDRYHATESCGRTPFNRWQLQLGTT